MSKLDDYLLEPQMQEMIRQEFLETQTDSASKIAACIKENKIKNAICLAHALKSHAALLEEETLQNAAGIIEKTCKNGDPPTTTQLETLERELSAVTQKLLAC